MADIELRLLGSLMAVVDGEPVDLSSRKQRALIALLAIHAGQVLSVDRLVDDLWGERPPPTARHALQVHVSNLRKLLGAAAVVTERPGYALKVPPESCDAVRFERMAASGRRALRNGDAATASSTLADALSLWRGPALADVLFEPFAPAEATRLEELKLTATEDRLTADLELGRHAELVGELEALVARLPTRERLWGLLMLAQYRSGRQVEALQAYKTLREKLRDELGLDPGPELQQLEAAILRQDPAIAAPVEESAAARGPAPSKPAPSESRRVATVLVADLVGFDSVAEALDPEDLRTLVDSCMSRLGRIVVRYDGAVDNVVGGELIAVFGAPVAHEDDAQRAVKAATDMQRAVADHPDDFAGLELRVGINTGEVLFAASGPPNARRLSVMGDVVNQARRLAATAEGIVLSDTTQTATEGRSAARAPFIGRDDELDQLRRVWRRTVAEARPHLVSILGEAGVGKSRLLAEFADGEERVVGGRCIPYGEALSYAPLAQSFRQVAGATEDPPAIARAKLGALVDDADMARHLALLSGLDDEGDREAGLVDERILHTSARRFLEALAAQQPLCLVVEDVHWADDALLDLLQAVARRAKDVPLLLVTLARPELLDRRPDWGGGLGAFTSISLAPLDPASTQELVDGLGQAHGLGADVLADIAAKSGGNPLFAEELVATVAEGSTGVPASLTSLLLARLDALPAEQQSALRRASVLGMTFWPGAVEALGGGEGLADALADLEQRDLLRVAAGSVLPDEVAYSFKHALIRDAAYDSLPRQQRTRLHGAAVEWLSRVAGDRVADFSDQLAHHAVASGQLERALEFLVTAADRARRAASHRREAALLAEAMELAEAPEFVAELRARRGQALSRLALWAEARAELEAAVAGLPDHDARRRAEVHCELSTACFWLLDTPAIAEHARIALDLAQQAGARDVELAARAQSALVQSAEGKVEEVLAGGRSIIKDAKAWGLDPPYERLNGFSLQLYLTGDWEASIAVAREAVRAGRDRGDTQGVLSHLPHIGMSAAACGRYDEAIAVFREARRFGEEYELVAGLPRAIAMSAGFRMELFDYEGAEEIQEEARDLGRRHFNPSAVSAGIDLLFNLTRRGDVGRAETMVDALGEEVASGAGWHGWLWRLRFTGLQAEMAAARGDWAAAVELAREAIAQSRAKRRAKYEANARVTLGRALAALGQKKEALVELRAAVAAAERLGNPALHSAVAAALLAVEPDEATMVAAEKSVQRVLDGLSDEVLRDRFLKRVQENGHLGGKASSSKA